MKFDGSAVFISEEGEYEYDRNLICAIMGFRLTWPVDMHCLMVMMRPGSCCDDGHFN